ncbi:hypothetical protein D7I43_01770 [Micromonospora globbae]|uniref:Lipoprotein n=2 Tax=Micromonospora globbae TaxID=1894969 RepID=A0A420F8Q7_9ACTN|nr:hypothetical protein D7I43_01770 [Micromonospora globbae]
METMRIRTLLAVGGLLVTLAVAGCGEAEAGGGVATAGGTPTAEVSGAAASGADQDRENFVRFSQCMRENGVPEYPDPKFNQNGGVNLSLPEGVSREKVAAAEQRCKRYMPNGGEPTKADPEVVEQLRAFSKCMRENGVPNFPDPTDAGLQVSNDALGMQPDDPRLTAAQEKCKRYRPNPKDGAPAGGLTTENKE